MTVKGNNKSLELVKELVELINKNNLTEIELEHSDKDSEGIYVRVSRQNNMTSPLMSNAQIDPTPSQNLSQPQHDEGTKEPSLTQSIETHPGTLLSPMVGTVYLAPEPEANPFVKVGDKISVGQTVLIVEAMKTLNQIPAVKAGVIKRILVEDGTPVEYGSPLIVIE